LKKGGCLCFSKKDIKQGTPEELTALFSQTFSGRKYRKQTKNGKMIFPLPLFLFLLLFLVTFTIGKYV